MVRRFLRRPEVEMVTGLPRSTIYDRMSEGTFPKPVKIGPQAVGWLEDEIAAWVEAKISERDGTEAA